MANSRKSTELLRKLNRSLGDDAPPSPPAAPVTPVARKRTKRVRAASGPEKPPMPAPAVAGTSSAPPSPVTLTAPAAVAPESASPSNEIVARPDVEAAAAASAEPERASSREGAARIVRDHVPFAVGAGLIPLPFVDLAVIGALQLKLLQALARHYGVPFQRTQAEAIVTSLLGSVGGTVVTSSALGSVLKFVPVLGALVSLTTLPVASGAITYAMGHLAIDHFESGGTMATFDLDVAQQAFERKIAEARQALR